jgi:hypothetical protein
MDPDNELYDAACEMLATAQRLSRAAAAERVERAVPATLGCIAASLGALTVGCAALGRDARPSQRRAFDDLVHARRRAQSACEAARASAAAGDSSPRAPEAPRWHFVRRALT